jgi:predicted translin family RNA/ssDNA-binding protein
MDHNPAGLKREICREFDKYDNGPVTYAELLSALKDIICNEAESIKGITQTEINYIQEKIKQAEVKVEHLQKIITKYNI